MAATRGRKEQKGEENERNVAVLKGVGGGDGEFGSGVIEGEGRDGGVVRSQLADPLFVFSVPDVDPVITSSGRKRPESCVCVCVCVSDSDSDKPCKSC